MLSFVSFYLRELSPFRGSRLSLLGQFAEKELTLPTWDAYSF